jgi:iron complex outermembrane recepter protein
VGAFTGFTGITNVLADGYDDYQIAQDVDPRAEIEESGVSIEFTWDISEDMTFSSITSVRSYEVVGMVDADFNSLDILPISGGETEQDTFTQEFRVDGIWNDITYVAGVYYFDQKLENHTALYLGEAANLLLVGGLPTGALLGGAPGCAFFGVTDEVCAGPAFPAGEGSNNFSEQQQTSWAVFA